MPTRKVNTITVMLCGLEISKRQVSSLIQRLDEEVEKRRNLRLEKEHRYLVNEGWFEKRYLTMAVQETD